MNLFRKEKFVGMKVWGCSIPRLLAPQHNHNIRRQPSSLIISIRSVTWVPNTLRAWRLFKFARSLNFYKSTSEKENSRILLLGRKKYGNFQWKPFEQKTSEWSKFSQLLRQQFFQIHQFLLFLYTIYDQLKIKATWTHPRDMEISKSKKEKAKSWKMQQRIAAFYWKL